MSKFIQMFSSQAYKWLEKNFENNVNLYRINCSNSEFWELIQQQLNKAELTLSPIITISNIELIKDFDQPEENDSWSQVGLKLYQCLGKLEPEIVMCPEFWSYLTHRYFHEYLFKKESTDLKQQYFISGYPRGLNACKVSRYYLAAKWTDEMLKEYELGSSLEECLIWIDTDQIKHMIDRRPFSSSKLRSCFIKLMIEENKSVLSRKTIRSFFKSINRLYGGSLIEILNSEELYKVMRAELERIKAA